MNKSEPGSRKKENGYPVNIIPLNFFPSNNKSIIPKEMTTQKVKSEWKD